jgi:tRNA A-37 threonylcarbamoyl transferase component Bud32
MVPYEKVEKMNIENYIESQYRELVEKGLNVEFSDLYNSFENVKLREVLTTLHYYFITLFRTMNERLPTGENGAHFWADPSRELISIIEITIGLYNTLKNSKYAFNIDDYYYELIKKCRNFLSSSGGSELPANMQKIDLYYIQPIFKKSQSISVKNKSINMVYDLKQIGEGSYANVYKYRDTFYNRTFVIKRAKKDLTEKEILRFKREYEEMQEFSSPYILEVYRYSESNNEYIMEYMDYTLDSYISRNNSKLTIAQRKGIAQQVLRAFDYIHSKKRLHRDISPKNILIKEYEDVPVIKIADFGLVKIPESKLTTVGTEFKGYFNDPSLVVEGFDTYNILHETYALTRIIYYIMTGRTNIEKITNSKLKIFIEKGLNVDKTKRFKNVFEMMQAFREV